MSKLPEIVINVIAVVAALGSGYLWYRALRQLLFGVWPLTPRLQPAPAWDPVVVSCVLFGSMASGPIVAQLMGAAAEGPLLRIQAQCLWSLLVLVGASGILALSGPLHGSDFGLQRAGWLEDLRAGGWGVLLSLLPVYLTMLPVQSYRTQHPVLETLLANPDVPTLAWVAFSAVICAPLMEELLYRVILQGSLVARLGPARGIVLASAAFCLVHQWPDCIPLFPLALILGYVYHRRRSYLAAVVLHALFNGANLLLALLQMSQTANPAWHH